MKEKCTCNEEITDSHLCPYAQEISGDEETECACCDYCTEQCANDI